jgi:hypothetical protein
MGAQLLRYRPRFNPQSLLGGTLLRARPTRRYFDNTVDAFNPQFWANESLAVLEENMIIGQLVDRDFEPIIQQYGDTINTRRVGDLKAYRKMTADNVTVQDVNAVNIQVQLNQHIHVSFLIRDGEESKAIVSLVDEYMAPSMIAQARTVDRILLGQVYRFLPNTYGRLQNMASTDVVDRITGVRNLMNINKAPLGARNVMITPNTETGMLRHVDFVDAAKIGDDGTALREANLGRLFGFNFFMSQNVPSIIASNTNVVGSINNAAGYPTGTTTATVDTLAAAISNGSWFTVDGDDNPQQVVSTVGGATPTSITFTPGLKHAVTDNAAVRIYTPGTVNNGPGYAAGYPKEIAVAGFTIAPQIGQMVSFGTGTDVYCVIDTTGLTGITLDRPLAVAINNADKVNIGPPGEYNFAFLRKAVTMVVRPLALPRAGTGALASVVNMNGLSIRATITYDGNKQGHLVTLDMLMGVQVLDQRLGAILLA